MKIHTFFCEPNLSILPINVVICLPQLFRLLYVHNLLHRKCSLAFASIVLLQWYLFHWVLLPDLLWWHTMDSSFTHKWAQANLLTYNTLALIDLWIDRVIWLRVYAYYDHCFMEGFSNCWLDWNMECNTECIFVHMQSRLNSEFIFALCNLG